ncbi:MAG: Nif3-like dinuclear metal center hexameric protein [Kineosporiaceae bacterium]
MARAAAGEAPTLSQVVEVLDAAYPRAQAADWDAVGLVLGDLAAPVRRVVLAVEATARTVQEALDDRADLLLVHHPLLLRPVHGVGTDTPKGALVHRLIRGGCALFTAHTNADVAAPGVSDALARVLGLTDLSPLDPHPGPQLDKIVVFVPEDAADPLVDALAAAGAGEIGDYRRCAFAAPGTGTFEPQPGAQPAIGAVGRREHVPEHRVEMVLPRARRAAVVTAMRAAHPYEEPAFDVLELADLPGPRGLGRVGDLASTVPLGVFAEHVARALPRTSAGVRVAGPLDATVRRVAVCGGAGDSLIGAARRAGADAFVTSDLRHHVASEALAVGPPWLVDVAHWAGEWPWLLGARERLLAGLDARGLTVVARVSTTSTDPWSIRL